MITKRFGSVFYARIMSQYGAGTDAVNFPTVHVLTDNDSKYLFGCAGIGLPIILLLFILAVRGGSTVFTVIITLVGLVFVVVFVASAMELQKWGPTEVHFAQWPLPLGSTTRARVVRVAKRAVPNASIETEVEIECEEWVRYTVGTDTRTDERTVYERESNVIGELVNNRFEAIIDIHIPANAGAPTIDLANNKVTWSLEIEIGELSTISKTADFDLLVAADLDRSLRNIQDEPRGDQS